MNDIDPARTLRYYLPIWLALMLLTVTVSVLGVVGNGAAAILWIASFLGAIVALVLIVAADELDESRAKRPLVPVDAARPEALADVLPRSRSKPIASRKRVRLSR